VYAIIFTNNRGYEKRRHQTEFKDGIRHETSLSSCGGIEPVSIAQDRAGENSESEFTQRFEQPQPDHHRQ
jgi:hypothetical protein